MEITGEEADKILNTFALYQCYGNLCTDCPYECDKNGHDCCMDDCKKRILDVIIGAK